MNDITHIGYSLYEMFYIFTIWSVIGWCIEVVDMKIETGEFQNRGFLQMPVCPIYGLGMLILTILLQDVKHSYPALFLCGMTVCTAVEYFAGWFFERVFHARWWDYSHMKFNYKGRICLRNALLFGFGTIFVIVSAEPVIERIIGAIPTRIGLNAAAVICAVFAGDIIVSVRKACAYSKNRLPDNSPYIIFKSHR